MDFIHDPYQPGETIAAVTTPPGEGGVAIIRISGDRAVDVAANVFSGPIRSYQSHTAHYGHIRDHEGKHVDDVLVLPMLGKRSYTGEDTVEIHCHGGALITRRVLDVVLKAGARAAKPGEFTFKSFMNGKLDLAQAEAVQTLISAKNEHALNAAENQLKGGLSKRILQFQENLTLITAILEAWVDFPEEGLEFASMEDVCQQLKDAQGHMTRLIHTFHDGKIAHDGVSLCLVGSPNVGKSSLMNALLDKDRAIVSPIAGTTRDILEDHLRLNGLNLRLMDTAGIRQSDEVIEQEGIRRSREAMSQADLILLVLDATQPLEGETYALLQELPPQKTLVAWNKTDLTHPSLPSIAFPHVVTISAKERLGLDQLREKIDAIIWKNGPPARDEVLITNVRHKEALQQSIESCQLVIDGLASGVSPEFLTMDMRRCLSELGKIIGTNISEDILSAIFSTFCIGK
ncbi:MAG: tRNA uridine-5-carboxymethylaminomethyl(34) synthesis GTPase MnmE [Parachlamydiaceae bacterium]|nr:tRNA uridine-5-carboxymethylaminomethyl(34) synthesis GTPase MnmE [Parachlamydiaceae bacterium]